MTRAPRPATLARLRSTVLALCAVALLAGCNFDSLLSTRSANEVSAAAEPEPDPGQVSGAVDRSPVVTLTASSDVVAPGGSTTLNWSVVHADACSASGGWAGPREASGTELVTNLTADDAFSLTCTGNGGSVTETLAVRVAEAPSVDFAAASPVVGRGEDALLTWDAREAEGCTAEGDWSGALAPSGSMAVGPIERDSSFTITCTGIGGSAMRMQKVVVPEAQVYWEAPSAAGDEYGSTIAGFVVHVGTESRSYDRSFDVPDPRASSYRVSDLARGATYYFAVTSYSADGRESVYSNEGVKTIP